MIISAKQAGVFALFVALVLALVLVLGLGVINQARGDGLPLEIACSQWRPYAFKENSKISGPAYEIVKQVMQRAQVDFTYKIKPWPRVYNNGLSKTNYMIGCLGRTQAREKLFHWIGPVTQGIDIYFYKLKSNPIEVSSIAQARQYKIATERDSYRQEFLQDQGFDESNMFLVSTNEQGIGMLKLKRYPLYLISERRLQVLSEAKGIDPTIFEKVLYGFSVKDYLAIGLNSSTHLVNKVTHAYQQLKAEGKIALPK